MSRYLTPSKIGLLALISLYTESVVPSAATIPVLSFIVSQLLPIEHMACVDTVSSFNHKFDLTVDTFQRATIGHASGIPGRTIWDLLLKKWWEINCLDGLHVFFGALSLLLAKTPQELQSAGEDAGSTNPKRLLLSRGSPLGAFTRRAQLEFTRLQFHDGIRLWKSFVIFRGPTMVMWKRRNPAVGKLSFDTNLEEDHFSLDDRLITLVYGDVTNEAPNEGSFSTDDIEKLLEYQVDQMQSM